ncbi:hypothetical protein LAUMK136_05352 [Mycobacterium attenuatum]|uniref:Uncharacterized protein n=1 Tax=Mycobacterium attenuatum TaxID=2341086 RepID=A0A498QED2_9MYCO|nr:hypothetical protein LAUMK136_05352 [Mycobacterium attenuatum]
MFVEFGELLARHVDDAAAVTLVIPVDMAEAVRRREGGMPYTAQRGSGIVSARTMCLPDGRVDVILNPGWLAAFDTEDHARHAMQDIRRCLIHEAQHAIMCQRGSDFDAYAFGAEEGATNREFARIAALVCDEHRAEWQAIQFTEHSPTTADAAVAVLDALGDQLAAAVDTYRSGPNGPEADFDLARAVLTACGHFWTQVGYWAAQYRVDDASIADLPTEINDLRLWQRYAGDLWARLQASLRVLPVEDLATDPETLCTAMRHVASALRSSLETIGFRYEDTDTGPIFRVTGSDFPHG